MEPWTDGAPLILKTELPMTRELRGWTEAGSVYRCDYRNPAPIARGSPWVGVSV